LGTKINILFLFSVLIFSLTLYHTFLPNSESNLDAQKFRSLLANPAFADDDDDEKEDERESKKAEKEARFTEKQSELEIGN